MTALKEVPTYAILISQYQVYAVIIDGLGVVLKICTVTEETTSSF
jgi:hypothetical protein